MVTLIAHPSAIRSAQVARPVERALTLLQAGVSIRLLIAAMMAGAVWMSIALGLA